MQEQDKKLKNDLGAAEQAIQAMIDAKENECKEIIRDFAENAKGMLDFLEADWDLRKAEAGMLGLKASLDQRVQDLSGAVKSILCYIRVLNVIREK